VLVTELARPRPSSPFLVLIMMPSSKLEWDPVEVVGL
jgi:hypothetical protein